MQYKYLNLSFSLYYMKLKTKNVHESKHSDKVFSENNQIKNALILLTWLLAYKTKQINKKRHKNVITQRMCHKSLRENNLKAYILASLFTIRV